MNTPQTFTISKVKGKYDSQYGKKVVFFTNETGETELSCFTSYPDNMEEGKQIYGHVEVNGQYHNFKWDKNPNGGAKRNSGGGITEDQYKIMMRLMEATNQNVLRILAKLDESEVNEGPF